MHEKEVEPLGKLVLVSGVKAEGPLVAHAGIFKRVWCKRRRVVCCAYVLINLLVINYL